MMRFCFRRHHLVRSLVLLMFPLDSETVKALFLMTLLGKKRILPMFHLEALVLLRTIKLRKLWELTPSSFHLHGSDTCIEQYYVITMLSVVTKVLKRIEQAINVLGNNNNKKNTDTAADELICVRVSVFCDIFMKMYHCHKSVGIHARFYIIT